LDGVLRSLDTRAEPGAVSPEALGWVADDLSSSVASIASWYECPDLMQQWLDSQPSDELRQRAAVETAIQVQSELLGMVLEAGVDLESSVGSDRSLVAMIAGWDDLLEVSMPFLAGLPPASPAAVEALDAALANSQQGWIHELLGLGVPVSADTMLAGGVPINAEVGAAVEAGHPLVVNPSGAFCTAQLSGTDPEADPAVVAWVREQLVAQDLSCE
jgi:hypothetical protein